MKKYTDIISPPDYVDLNWGQHLYIRAANHKVLELVKKYCANKPEVELVEIGCGPGMLLSDLAAIDNLKVTAIDTDPTFLAFAKSKLPDPSIINFQHASAEHYIHPTAVDIYYSCGVHHHIGKDITATYLQNIANGLKPEGVYLLVDEFIPSYKSEEERASKLMIWYSHVIAHALTHDHHYLAEEEAKTMLDDLSEGETCSGIKNDRQINIVLEHTKGIADAAETDLAHAADLAQKMLQDLIAHASFQKSGKLSMDISRHDYKISGEILTQELTPIGLKISDCLNYGNPEIGTLSIYVIQNA